MRRLLAVAVLAGIIARCLHLAAGDHYFILSTDSYYFHHLAGRTIGPPVIHSGLVYPLRSFPGGVDIGCIILPLLIGAAVILGAYFLGCRLYDKRVGIGAAFTAALLPFSVVITAAGFVDRDGLSVLLVGAAVGAYWLLKDKNKYLAGLLPVVISQALFYFWAWVGPVIIVMLILAVTASLLYTRGNIPRVAVGIVVAGITEAALLNGNIGVHSDSLLKMASPGSDASTGYAEIGGLTLQYWIWFGFFSLTVFGGALLVFKDRHNENSFMLFIWFVAAIFGALFAQRVLIFIIPPACVLSGLCIARALGSMSMFTRAQARAVAGWLIILIVCSSFYQAYNLHKFRGMSPNDDWLNACYWLRDNTDSQAVILSHWDYGYWILDLAERRPVAAGRAVFESEVMSIYDDPDNMARVMAAAAAGYFICPKADLAEIKTPFYENDTIVIYRGAQYDNEIGKTDAGNDK